MQMVDRANRGFLKAGELESVFRAGLDEELGLAMAPQLGSRVTAGVNQRPLRFLEATYRIAARLPADADSVPSDLIDKLTDGFTTQDRAAAGCCQSNANRSPHDAGWALSAAAQLARICHSASAAERRSL